MIAQHSGFSPAELERFKAAQRASFAVLEEVADGLQAGVSERQVTMRITRGFRALGIASYFHLPVVLFGARTALPERWCLRDFCPTRNRLRPGDAIILDASPIFDGYVVDTSLSTRLGENEDHHRMMMDLAGFRDLIAARVREGASFRAIAIETDARIRALGYQNRHQAHIEGTLGHRVVRIRRPRPKWTFQKGFDVQAAAWFILRTAASRLFPVSPNWNVKTSSDHRPWDGLWALEPHVAKGDVGAKWEELLVIQDGKVFWLDDDNPNVRYWQRHGAEVAHCPAAGHGPA